MQRIGSKARIIRELLAGAKFQVDYYQREYRWGRKQVQELLDDLEDAFLDNYTPGAEREAVLGYSHYFLGSVIISKPAETGPGFIVDGQQRLTTLTLLLMHLYRELDEEEEGTKTAVANCIYSSQVGRFSFNLDVPERVGCMDALFRGRQPNVEGQPESVSNIVTRFEEVQNRLSLEEAQPGEQPRIDKAALPFFADWLLEKVYLVEIEAASDADAYTIFETMNDRGLSLTPTEMLKGYLLANITDGGDRFAANDVWKRRVTALQELGKEEDADSIKSWLRSQYAEDLRERSRNAAPRDFERIGTEFHRWVRDKKDDIGLGHPSAFSLFIRNDFDFYTRRYEEIRRAGDGLTNGLEEIAYNAWHSFTLQYTVLMAPLRIDDNGAIIRKKLRLVATYLDILLARRIWNWRDIGYSTMSYAMFSLARDVRRKEAQDLARLLHSRLNGEESFAGNAYWFGLHQRNASKVHYLLARLTDFVEMQSGRLPSRYHEYIQRGGNDAYEIEHIWADHPELHDDEFEHPEDFKRSRDRIGGLVLLPKRFNASFGDLEYVAKLEHYYGQNLLAKSLHERAYENNPGFVNFARTSGLPFRPHPEFKRADNDARQELYLRIAERIWDPEKLLRIAEE